MQQHSKCELRKALANGVDVAEVANLAARACREEGLRPVILGGSDQLNFDSTGMRGLSERAVLGV